MLGEIALYAFMVLVLTGTFLVFFFHPSTSPVVYDGSYKPLQGVEMSQAYASVINISFDVRAGLLIRQIHHWAAVVFIAAVVLHLARVFLTGAFRQPRQLNWIVGTTLLVIALFSGFTGYSIVDDLLSGTGLVIGNSVALSVPIVGPWMASLLFGGTVPNANIVPRLYSLHVMVLPGVLFLLLGIHLAVVWRQKHTNYPGRDRTNDTIVGTRLWPTYASKAAGFMLIVCSILVALGAFVQINPVWLYGPYSPTAITTGVQPDWYLGWLEGALRLFPSWDLHVFGYLIPGPFFAGALLGLVVFGGIYTWPFLEAWLTGDSAVHHVLDRPSEHPVRTGIGFTVASFMAILLIAGSDDVMAVIFDAHVDSLRKILLGLLIVLPLLIGALTYSTCRFVLSPKPRD